MNNKKQLEVYIIKKNDSTKMLKFGGITNWHKNP